MIPNGLILLYHRIGRAANDPWSLNVAPDCLAAHLAAICSTADPVCLADLIEDVSPRRGRLRVAVTFDDGYADNLHVALPLLEAHGIPATFFIASGAIDNPHGYWWDELAHALLRPGLLPETFEAARRRFELHADAEYSHERATRHSAWRAWQDQPPTRRHQLYLMLWRAYREMSDAEQADLISYVRDWSRCADSIVSHRLLSSAEVRELSASPLATVGAHTINHPQLSALPLDEQEREIAGARDALTALLGSQPRDFAYPFGGAADYTTDTVALVKRAGFRCACANGPGPGTSDWFQLPRVFVHDSDGAAMSQLLSR